MDKFAYFELYYLNLQLISADIRVNNPAYMAWEATERSHFDQYGNFKYKEYTTFRRVKYRWNLKRLPTKR